MNGPVESGRYLSPYNELHEINRKEYMNKVTHKLKGSDYGSSTEPSPFVPLPAVTYFNTSLTNGPVGSFRYFLPYSALHEGLYAFPTTSSNSLPPGQRPRLRPSSKVKIHGSYDRGIQGAIEDTTVITNAHVDNCSGVRELTGTYTNPSTIGKTPLTPYRPATTFILVVGYRGRCSPSH